jgi:uncharacterized protein (DUF433 family)
MMRRPGSSQQDSGTDRHILGPVDVHPRIAERAVEPRYTIPEAASFIARPTSTVRRWAVGNVRRRGDEIRRDPPLIHADGFVHGPLPLSFLNLLELRFLAAYRKHVPLQSIRRALDFAARELHVERPLLTARFKANGKSLFLKFAAEGSDPYLLNASEHGQIAWPEALDEFIASVDYDKREHHAFRWWPLGRGEPVIVDTLLNGGIPSTALSGVRTNAIAVHRGEGLHVPEIADDVGATEEEVRAALRFERVAA